MTSPDAQEEIASNLATYVKGDADAPAAKERTLNVMARPNADQPR